MLVFFLLLFVYLPPPPDPQNCIFMHYNVDKYTYMGKYMGDFLAFQYKMT
jgi:hypothetical protein